MRIRTRRGLLTAAAVMWLSSATVYVTAEAVAASAFPGYSYATNYISDLGIPTMGEYDGRPIDSPLAAVMNAGFALHGLFVLAGAALAAVALAGRNRLGRALFVLAALAHCVGSILIAVVPGSEQSAAAGTIGVHVLGAGLAIVGGNLALIVAGVWGGRSGAGAGYRLFAVTLGVLGIASIVVLQTGVGGGVPDGVWERASVYAITVWEVVTAIVILSGFGARSRERGAGADR